MPTMRDIKGRIRSVTTTKKTTKAMNLVSSSKLARAKVKLNKGNPFFEQMRRAIGNVIHGADDIDHKYFDTRNIKRTLIVIIANDRGLCGGYNTNVCKLALKTANKIAAKSPDNAVVFYTIGNKAADYVDNLHHHRRGMDIHEEGEDTNSIGHVSGISENPFYEDAIEITDKIMPLYENGEIDEVIVCYTQFVSAITYVPSTMRILPLDRADFPLEKEAGSMRPLMTFEPSAKAVLNYAVPKYLATQIFAALVTSAASGQAATMTAMDSATENAEKIIGDLTLIYNRARQAAITQEISEIVGGANALE